MRSIDDAVILNLFMWKKFDKKANLRIIKKIRNKGRKKAVILFSYWTGTSKVYIPFMNRLGADYTYILYEYPNEIMSKDAQVSIGYLKKILADASKEIRKLRKSGVKEITLVGSSSGSDMAFQLANAVKVENLVVNMMDRNVASCIFTSPIYSLLKKSFIKQGLRLKEIDKLYHFISPEYNIGKLKKFGTKILIIISKNDIFCTYEELKPFISLLDRKKINYTLHIHRIFGHVITMFRNLSLPGRMVRFVRSN